MTVLLFRRAFVQLALKIFNREKGGYKKTTFWGLQLTLLTKTMPVGWNSESDGG